jgi:hypothetical protein
LYKEQDMKKLVKILGIMAAALLVGGMIIACTHAEGGLGTGVAPNPSAPALVGGPPPSTPGTPTPPNSSVPQEFKDEVFAAYADDPDEFADMAAFLGLPPNPYNWTEAQWAQVYAIYGAYDDDEVPQSFKTTITTAYSSMGATMFATYVLGTFGLSSLPSNPNNWSDSQWAQAYDVLGNIDISQYL